MQFKGYAKSVIGGREKNQDSFLVEDDKALYAVADGIGGGFNGEIASKMAVEGFKARFNPSQTMTEIAKYVQNSIYMEAINQFGEPLMGTTFTGVHLNLDEALLCQIGDSRLYLYDGSLLKQLTVDHEQYDEKLKGTTLVSYLGIDSQAYELQIQEEVFKVKPGDRLLICSDGLYKQLDDAKISQIIKENFSNTEMLIEKLCSEAEKAEHSDNITVVFVEIEE